MGKGEEAAAGWLRVARIRAYPLKGAGGFDLPEVRLGAFGVPGDRCWMLVRPGGAFISQRTDPRLALLRVSPVPGAGHPATLREGGNGDTGFSFQLRAPGMEALVLTPPLQFESPDGCPHPPGQRRRVGGGGGGSLVLRVPSAGVSPGVFSSRAPSTGRSLLRPGSPDGLLGRVPASPHHRGVFGRSEREVGTSLEHAPVSTESRPEGGEPWEEDRWRVLDIGGVRVELVKPCARCSVTTVDPGTALRGREPLRTLGGFRGWEGKAYFGQNAVVSGDGSFRVGQNVRILEEGGMRPPLGP